MNNRYNYNNSVATGNYSSNTHAAKSASAYSDSMKVMQKPLFLVAAAMLMLIFFTGTAHASTLSTPSLTLTPTTMNFGQTTSEATITWSGGTSPYTVDLNYGYSSSCSSDTTSYNSVQVSGTSSVATISLPVGTYYFCAVVTDSSTPTNSITSSTTPIELISYSPIAFIV